MNVTVKSSELRRILSNALLFAAQDDSRPQLCGVHLVVHPGRQRIWAVGVDPYCLAYDSTEILDAGGAFERTLPREIVELILRETSLSYQAKDRLATSIWPDKVVIGNVAAAYTELEGYPNFRQVLPDTAKRGLAAIAITRVNPFFLARLDKVKKGNGYPFASVYLYGELAPIEVTIGATFKAVVMPLRADGAGNEPVDPPLVDAVEEQPEPTPIRKLELLEPSAPAATA